ncbi:MAG: MaoC family dehydratase N-terminal domain-containing protein [Chloroflexi bacterium]|nr:MaoC family dehydratase N-terminal domain-containing protein [Chloroflexota bacterium]
MQQKLQFDRSFLGRRLEGGVHQLTKEMVDRFCELFGEIAPIYTNDAEARRLGYRGQLVPPVMLSILRHNGSRPDIGLRFSYRRSIHGGQRLQVFAPICVGDILTASVVLKDVYAKTGRSGTMVFVVWQTDFTSQQGALVAYLRESMVLIE